MRSGPGLSGHHNPAEALRLLRCATRLAPWAPCRHRCYCNASERRMVAAVRVAHRIQALPAELWHLFLRLPRDLAPAAVYPPLPYV